MNTVTLTVEQFNNNLKIISERYRDNRFSQIFNPSREYRTINLKRIVELQPNKEAVNNINFKRLEEMYNLGCDIILTSDNGDWVHPYLTDRNYYLVDEITRRNIDYLGKSYPDLLSIKGADFHGEGEILSPTQIVPDNIPGFVSMLGKFNSALTFNSAETMATILIGLGLKEFRYHYNPE